MSGTTLPARSTRRSRGAAQSGLYIRVSDVGGVVPSIADADVIVPLRKTFYGITRSRCGSPEVTL